jgi:CheY-like chemotaxis protein
MSKGKILIVDDEKDIMMVLSEIIKNEGYEVITAYSGKRALERVKDEKPDLVILDIMMPGLDGLTVCEQIKNDPATRDTKIIILTAKDTGSSLQEALERKADWFIGKPCDGKSLVSRIAILLAAHKK